MGNKSTKIQHCVNPGILPSHEVRFFQDTRTYSVHGQVLFFTAHGGHWSGDDREHHFVGVYHPDHGALVALLNMAIVQSVTELLDEHEA